MVDREQREEGGEKRAMRVVIIVGFEDMQLSYMHVFNLKVS